MSRFLVAVLGALLMISVGCQDKDKSDMKGDSKSMSADACPKCPGVQKMTADGKCETCGMKMSAMDACPKCPGMQTATAAGKCSACGAMVSAAGADACAHCAGVQVATAEGKCPGCGAMVKK